MRGALKIQAENIPIEPDPDNAGEGIRETLKTNGLLPQILPFKS